MTEIVIKVKRHGRRSGMRDGWTVVECAMRNELHPKGDRIVVQTHKGSIAPIEFRRIESLTTIGELHSLALHAARDLDREIAVFIKEVRLCGKTGLIVYVEQRGQDHL